MPMDALCLSAVLLSLIHIFLGLVLGHAFLDGLGSGLNDSLGVSQAQAGEDVYKRQAMLRSVGNSRQPFYCVAVTAGVNIVLDLSLIHI